MKIFAPENLNFEKLLKTNPGWKLKSCILYRLIDPLSRFPAYDRQQLEKSTKNGFTNLSSKIMEGVTYKYKQYLDYLIKHVVDSDNIYIKGKKCRGYRYKNEYVQPVREVELPDIERKKDVYPGYEHLQKYFNPKLTIDIDATIDYLSDELKKSNADERKKILDHNSKYIIAHEIKSGNGFFKVDSTAGRVHTPISVISKELRKNISYDNNTLVEIDLSNSQPYFSTLLMRESFFSSNSSINIDLINQAFTTKPHPTTSLIFETKRKKNQEVEKYFDLVQGDIYEYVAKETNLTRDEAKQMFIICMYKHPGFTSSDLINDYPKLPEFEKAVKTKIFPGIFKVWDLIKKADYKSLAVLLQRIESYVFIEKISRRIARERPEMPIFPLHDCIVSCDGNQDYISGIIKDELIEHTGISPKLNIKYWSNENHD